MTMVAAMQGDGIIKKMGKGKIGYTKTFDKIVNYSFGCLTTIEKADGTISHIDTRESWDQMVPGIGLYKKK